MGDRCEWKKVFVAAIVVALVYAALDYVIHDVLLKQTYLATAELWRSMDVMRSKMWALPVGYFAFGLLFAVIYTFGYTPGRSGVTQGIRYGLLIGVLTWGAGLLIMYPFVPWPDTLYQAMFGMGFAEYALLGLVLGAVYKPAK